jgi:hypothetical protein
MPHHVLQWADLFLYGCYGSQCNGQTSVAGAAVTIGTTTYNFGVTTTSSGVTPHADGDYLAQFTDGESLNVLQFATCTSTTRCTLPT